MSERRPTTNGIPASSSVLDARLRRLFQPPDAGRLAAIGRAVVREAAAPPRRRSPALRRLAVAAAIVGAITGGWLIVRSLVPPAGNGYTPPAWRSLAAAYDDWLAEGFEPMWVCANDREFIDTFRDTYHQGLLLGELPPGTTALGLAYCNCLSARTTAVLATADGLPVVVFIDRIERDTPPVTAEGLHVHRRRIGRLVLYELSPLDEPALLPWFRNPDDGER